MVHIHCVLNICLCSHMSTLWELRTKGTHANTQMLKSEEVSVSLSPWKDGSSSEPCGPVDSEGDDNTYLASYENEQDHHT